MKSRSRRRPKRSTMSFRVEKQESLETNVSTDSNTADVVMVIDEESKDDEKKKDDDKKVEEVKPAGAEITIPKDLLHKTQTKVIKAAPKQSSCTECGKKHDSHSRECTSCGISYCRTHKKVFMTKLAKKTWTCSVGNGCKRAPDVTEPTTEEDKDTPGAVDRYRKFSSVVSRHDVGVARKVTPPPEEMAKAVEKSEEQDVAASEKREEEEKAKAAAAAAEKKRKDEEAAAAEKKRKEEETAAAKRKESTDKKLEALKKRLVRFYKVYKPSQIPRVSEIAAKYLDRSEELIEALQVSDEYVCVFLSKQHTTTTIYT